MSVEKGGIANAPSCLVAYSQADMEAIENAMRDGLSGKLVKLATDYQHTGQFSLFPGVI